MNRLPKIGERVRYPGGLVAGPCTGTVEHHYKEYVYAKDTDWSSDEPPVITGEAPVQQWRVRMRVDSIPKPWAYPGRDVFAPEVSELEEIAP